MNIVTATDSYKSLCHWACMPENTEGVYSYFEARKGSEFDETVFFGLQVYLKKYLEGVVITEEKIQLAKSLLAVHGGSADLFNEAGWRYILETYGGKLPLRIKAVPEGTVVPISNVLMTVENTDPNCYWLTNYLETILSHVWYGTTVATKSYTTRKIIEGYLKETASEDFAGIQFMLHDFGYRGVSSIESAGIGGAAHLVNFLGTDTIAGIETAMEFYGSDVCGYSVPATEHSVMTALGPEGEADVVEKLLDTYPTGILSVVGDSYDIFSFAKEIIGTKFRERILERDGVFVLRPDSGEPIGTVLQLLQILSDQFGCTRNEKNYIVLNPKIRLIWGDGLDTEKIDEILSAMKKCRWSAENIVFGQGGGLLQRVNRDSCRCAFKSSAQKRAGEWVDIYKDPIDSSKKSKRGRLALEKDEDGTFRTVRESEAENDQLVLVFEDGVLYNEITFDEVRKNAWG